MSDRNQVRDRTLILRVFVPSLQARLRDKMKEVEDQPQNSKEGSILDLDGVTCEPTEDGSSLWNFRCDGMAYPARLVNLPCPIEVHKTHDHAMYYKCADVAQALIVYEDGSALEEAEAAPKVEGFPSYYHSGITPAMKRVVERRFAAREHRANAPPRSEVGRVEVELKELIDEISRDTGKKSKTKTPTLGSAQNSNKIIEEVVEDIVDYEPWMDDNGRQPYGVEFDEKDILCTKHPEVWLNPDEFAATTKEAAEKEEAAKQLQEQQQAKKKSKKKDGSSKKKKKKEEKQHDSPSVPSQKKGIAALKTREPIDEVTQAAAQWSQMDNTDDMLTELGDFFDFEGGDDQELFGDLGA